MFSAKSQLPQWGGCLIKFNNPIDATLLMQLLIGFDLFGIAFYEPHFDAGISLMLNMKKCSLETMFFKEWFGFYNKHCFRKSLFPEPAKIKSTLNTFKQ